MKTQIKVLFVCMLFLPVGLVAQDADQPASSNVLPSDLALLIGHWEGTLTYLDYNTNEPYTLPAHLDVAPGRNDYQINASHIFPGEPKANSDFKLNISRSGNKLNKRKVISRTVLPDGKIQIITEYSYKDGDEKKMATNRVTYTIGKDTYSVRKDVQFEGTNDWTMLNNYTYQKK
ncbi:MAG: hypothetical protein KDC34_11210 [Saprospiraceae bacterium]|nr:hypothetical protein [Saprospiraceae bacterium]